MGMVLSVTRSRQVYIELVEATALFYLTNERDSGGLYTYIDNRASIGTSRYL